MAPPDLELPPLWAGCRICQQVQDDEFRSLAQLQWAFTQQPGLHEAVDVLHGVLHMAPGFSPATRLLERCAARLGDPPGAVGRP
jgi:hypothetical protein